MGSFSIWHWLIVAIILAVFIWPAARVARKAGYSGWWSILIMVPLANILIIWLFAFADWPTSKNMAGRSGA